MIQCCGLLARERQSWGENDGVGCISVDRLVLLDGVLSFFCVGVPSQVGVGDGSDGDELRRMETLIWDKRKFATVDFWRRSRDAAQQGGRNHSRPLQLGSMFRGCLGICELHLEKIYGSNHSRLFVQHPRP